MKFSLVSVALAGVGVAAQPRSDFASWVMDSTVHVAGGYGQNYNIESSVMTLTPAAGNTAGFWNTEVQVADLSLGRGDVGAAVVNGKAYVVGGFAAQGDNWFATGQVEEYDAAQNSWATVSPILLARGDKTVVSFENKLWVMGGESMLDGSGVVDDVESYDPATDEWTAETEIPAPSRFRFSGAALGDSLYMFGGQDEAFNSTHEILDVVQRREDLGNGQWQWASSTSMPVPLSDTSAAVHGNAVFVSGGCLGPQEQGGSCAAMSDKVYKFALTDPTDPADRGTWEEVATMTTKRSRHGSAVVDGVLYVFGGRDESDVAVAKVEALHLAQGTWSTFSAEMGANAPASIAPTDAPTTPAGSAGTKNHAGVAAAVLVMAVAALH